MNIAVVGWYGYGNIGDQLLACCVVHSISRGIPDSRPHILTLNERDGATVGCPAVRVMWPYHRLMGVRGLASTLRHVIRTRGRWLRSLYDAQVLVVGGGSLLHDRQLANLEMWERLLRLYRATGCRIVFYGVGLDPVRPGEAEVLRNRILRLADGISVRDPASLALAREAGVERVCLAADPVVNCPLVSTPRGPRSERKVRTIGLNLRPMFKLDTAVLVAEGTALVCEVLSRVDAEIAFIPMWEGDVVVAQRIRESLPSDLAPRLRLLPYTEVPAEHLALYAELDAVIAMRFHTLVLAVLAGIPVIGLEYDPKVGEFLRAVDMEAYRVKLASGSGEDWRGIEVVRVASLVAEVLQHRSELSARVLRAVDALKRREVANLAMLRRVLGQLTADHEPNGPGFVSDDSVAGDGGVT